ncbi:branched-chain amino acid permease protein/azaleucin resistance protein AzlC [Gottschalkia purinilytica]|uniref:Branched-chain amino acid permease protein/azaleucin resistance protein AzlC n=1 Tax=Gottschalkia purinilytica TaxID=1503 RepID=A0A0L0W727_GOTPU|nr:AzlC family ABC transporter permease [Gottschalkia purinilytica]KNF07319.1 branched-chain amino acid permease protein/azaleucin resistance protein AzlC [Gottschalkia purinilytica]
MKNILKNKDIKEGLISSVPIVIGYLSISITFGILAKSSSVSFIDAMLMSAFVYAGAGQFMAINLMISGIGAGEIIFTTLLINFRFFLISASFVNRLNEKLGKWNLFIGHTLTDETFSIISFREKEIKKDYVIPLQITSYSSWVIGTLIGYIAGGLLPKILIDSMGMALYAMFVSILVPQFKKNYKIAILVALSAILNTLFTYFNFLPQGWGLILSIVISSAIGASLFKDDNNSGVNDDE